REDYQHSSWLDLRGAFCEREPPARGRGSARRLIDHRSNRGHAMASGLEERFQTLPEIMRAAEAGPPPGPFGHPVGGTETETTLRRNRYALDSIAFRPRVLRNVSKIDTSSTLFGKPVRIPVMLAPIGGLESFDPAGGAASAKASEEFGVPHMLSSVCM